MPGGATHGPGSQPSDPVDLEQIGRAMGRRPRIHRILPGVAAHLADHRSIPDVQLRMMATAETPLVAPAEIRRLARRIARRYGPEKIVLFGSYATGRPSRHSDVDLLIILNTRRDLSEVASRIACEMSPPFPVDIVVRTPADVRWRLAERECFLTEILRTGKVLYEAHHARMGEESRG